MASPGSHADATTPSPLSLQQCHHPVPTVPTPCPPPCPHCPHAARGTRIRHTNERSARDGGLPGGLQCTADGAGSGLLGGHSLTASSPALPPPLPHSLQEEAAAVDRPHGAAPERLLPPQQHRHPEGESGGAAEGAEGRQRLRSAPPEEPVGVPSPGRRSTSFRRPGQLLRQRLRPALCPQAVTCRGRAAPSPGSVNSAAQSWWNSWMDAHPSPSPRCWSPPGSLGDLCAGAEPTRTLRCARL